MGSTNWLASSVTEQIAGQQIQHILIFAWTEIIRTLMEQWRNKYHNSRSEWVTVCEWLNNSQSRGFDPHAIIIILSKMKNLSFYIINPFNSSTESWMLAYIYLWAVTWIVFQQSQSQPLIMYVHSWYGLVECVWQSWIVSFWASFLHDF